MCVVSMVGDHYSEKWRLIDRRIFYPLTPPLTRPPEVYPPITREEVDQLRAEVAEMVALMKRAKKYDEQNGEPECEMDEKLRVLRAVAKLVGVDLDAVLKEQASAQ